VENERDTAQNLSAQPSTTPVRSNYESMTVTPSSAVAGFSIREPQTDEERFAMQFVDTLFWRDHDAVASMTNLSSLAPSAPLYTGEPEDLYYVIISRCVGFMNFQVDLNYNDFDFAKDMYHGLHITWRDRGTPNAGSVGIVDITDVGIVVAHSWDGTREGFYAAGKKRGTDIEVYGAATIRVTVEKAADGTTSVVAAPYKPGVHGELIDQAFEYTVPVGGVVTFRGEVLEPVRQADGFRNTLNVYSIEGMHYRVPEEITVDFGETYGVIRDCLIVDNFGRSIDDGLLLLRSNSDAGHIYSRFPSLAITMPEYTDMNAKIENALIQTVEHILTLLETDNYQGFADKLVGSSEAWRMRRTLERDFNNWVSAERESSHAGIPRTLMIRNMYVLTPNSISIDFYNTLVAPSGISYWSMSTFTLSNVDGEWKIWSMTPELLSRSTASWREITEELIIDFSTAITIR